MCPDPHSLQPPFSPASLSSSQSTFNLNVRQSHLEGSGKETDAHFPAPEFLIQEAWERAPKVAFLSSRWYYAAGLGATHTLGTTPVCSARKTEPRRPNFLVHGFPSANSILFVLGQSICYQGRGWILWGFFFSYFSPFKNNPPLKRLSLSICCLFFHTRPKPFPCNAGLLKYWISLLLHQLPQPGLR